MAMTLLRSVVFYSGRVQGVGFRYTTLQVAKQFEVCGYVQNLPDGRVQLEAEGEKDQVDAFVNEVESELSSYIRKMEIHRESVTGRKYATFEIRK